MRASIKEKAIRLLRWSERYTKTDMVYLARGGFWINMGATTVTLFSFLLYVAFARFLPKEIYGTYQYLLSVSAIIGTFTLSGMNTAVSRAVARGYEGTYRASIRMQFRWAVIPLVGALAGSAYYALAGNIPLAVGLALIGLATPLVTTFNTYSAFLTGKGDFRRVFFYNFTLNIFFYGGLIIAAWYSASALVLLFVNLSVNAVVLALLHRQILRTFKPDTAVDADTLSYGKHLSAMGIFSAIVGQIDNILVFHYLGAADLAIYSLATAIPDRAASFSRFLSMTAMPKFAARTDEQIRASIGPKLVKLTLVAIMGAVLYLFVAPFLFRIFFPAYTASIPFSAFYAFGMIGIGGTVALSALSSRRRTKDLYLFNIVTPILQLALQLGGALFYGLWGLVIGKTVSMFLTNAFAVVLLLRTQRETSPGARD
jgi:O-antigen/teichoic acid export membrane protein